MRCTLEEIKEKALSVIKGLIQGKSSTIKMNDSGRVSFNYGASSKYATKEAAFAIAQSKIKKVEKWAVETFGKEYNKGWLTIGQNQTEVWLDYTFPSNLKTAYVDKITMQEYLDRVDTEYFAEQKQIKEDYIDSLLREDEQAVYLFNEYGQGFKNVQEYVDSLLEEDEFDDMIGNPDTNQPDYADYVTHKEDLLKKVEKKLSKLYNEKRINNTSQITKEISRFNKIKKNLQEDLDVYEKNGDKFKIVKEFFNKDLDLIGELLKNPTIDNVFLAKELFDYIKNVGDTRLANSKNKLFKNEAGKKYEAEVEALLKELNKDMNFRENEIENAIDVLFLELLNKNSTNLMKLYPDKTIEEVKEALLESTSDISFLEGQFMATGEKMMGNNNVLDDLLRLEYEKKELTSSSKSQRIIQKIDALMPNVQKELAKLGLGLKSKAGKLFYEGFDYKLFYQKDADGEFKSALVGKFSTNWEHFTKNLNNEYNKLIAKAREDKDWGEVERLLSNKYSDLKDKSDFVDFSLLHDIYENNSYYDEFKRGDSAQAAAYKQSIIDKIGEEEYSDLIENQKNLFDTYFDEVQMIIDYKLDLEGVSEVKDLSKDAQENLDLNIRRLNPLELLNSKNGMIEYQIGSQRNEKPSYLKYNTFIPKEKTSSNLDTGFYDKSFKDIESNPVLYEFWKTIREASLLINENLIDSDLKLRANSLLHLKKQFSETTLDKSFTDIILQGLGKLLNVKSFIKDFMSDKQTYHPNVKDVVLPSEIKSHEGQVYKEHSLVLTEMNNIFGRQLGETEVISWNTIPLKKQSDILNVLGLNTPSDLINVTGDVFPLKKLKVFSERKVLERQTFNLPMMMKAFLELSAEHKARTEYKNEAQIYMEKSKAILVKENSTFRNEGDIRRNESDRQEFFYNSVILNKNQKDHSGNISTKLIKMANSHEFNKLGRHFYKNFSKEEKEIYDSATKRLTTLETEIAAEIRPKKLEKLNLEKQELEARVRILGKDYLFSALWNNAINNLTIKVGLGYNILANIRNKIQGQTALLSRDGEFWEKGNIYPVNHFVGLNKLRFINKDYAREWDVATLFISQLNLIQDGTNELQRAESKIKNKTRMLSPMYGTELVEYYNQVPGILSMAMDLRIKDNNGVEHPLFDGSTFPAYFNNNGKLELKPEFKNDENIANFETMDSKDTIDFKTNANDMIRSLNGDYSKTGVTQIKGSIYGKSLMLFKTWLPRYISSRYKFEQKNVRTGEIETGYLLSTFLNKRTSVTGGFMLGITGIIGVLSSSPLFIALPIFAGVAAFGLSKYHISKKSQIGPVIDNTEPISIGQQAMFVLKMISPHKILEVPINSIMGKEFIKPVEFKESLNLTKQEKRDIRLMARNMQNTVIMMMLKIGVQALLADNEEDEPEGKAGSKQRMRHLAQKEHREQYKAKHNFIENLLTGMYQETSLAVEPTNLVSTLGSKNSLEGPFDKLVKMSASLIRYGYGGDEIEKGEREGQSRVSTAIRKTILPSLFRDIGRDTWRAGFETSMEREWVTSEGIDGMFDTQYKKDKKSATKERAKTKKQAIKSIEEAIGQNLDELTPELRKKMEKRATKQAKLASPNPDRRLYDDDQKKIESKE